MKVGIVVTGLFTGANSYKDEHGGVRWSVDIATGRETYRIYLDQEALFFNPEKDLVFGQCYSFSARPYINSHNRMSWTGGSLIDESE